VAEICKAIFFVYRPPMPQYNKKTPATDGRIPLYLRSLRSTQFNRTAILLANAFGVTLDYLIGVLEDEEASGLVAAVSS